MSDQVPVKASRPQYLWRVFQALFYKNLLIKLRSPLASVCELLLPLLFTAAMAGLFTVNFVQSFPTPQAYSPANNYQQPYELPGPWSSPATDRNPSFSGGAFRVMPLGGVLPWRLNRVNQRLAIVPQTPAQQPAVDSLLSFIGANYPALNGSNIGDTGFNFTNPYLSSVYFPSLLSQTVTFPSEDSLASYIRSSSYGSPGTYKIWAAIVINGNPPALDYSIRMNSSTVPTTLPADQVNPLQRGVDLFGLQRYVWSIPDKTGIGWTEATLDPIDQLALPGFMSLQLMVDRWAINASVPLSSMNQQLLLDTFQFLYGQMWDFSDPTIPMPYIPQLLWNINGINQTAGEIAFAAVAATIGLGESFAPQQVDLIPFPTPAYKEALLFFAISFSFGLFFILAWLYSVARFIRGIVMEKEAKISEGLRMAGLPVWISVASLMTLYVVQYAIVAAIAAGLMRATIFTHCDGGLLFALVFLMGVSSAGYAYLVSVFFSSARTASTVGVLLFLGGFLPYYGVNTAATSTGGKVAASLLSPTAFGLAILQLCQYEQRGAGITNATVFNLSTNWSFFLSLLMMAVDFPLYLILASYIRAMLPASLRDYGVPRKWYFPCTSGFWRNEMCFCFCSGRPGRGRGPSHDPAVAAHDAAAHKREAPHHKERQHNLPPADASFFESPDPTLLAMEASGRTVRLEGIRKVFDTPEGPKLAVDDLSLTFYEGQISVLLGRNGCGKSTTLSILTGLYEATSGSVTAFGIDTNDDSYESLYASLGVVPQQDVLWPELSVREHLELFATVKRVPKASMNAEIKKALAEVGLSEKEFARTGTLSGGQKRKCCLAMALLGGSRLLVLDEVTSGMDPFSRRSTWACLQAAKREGRTIILCSHFLDEAELIGDRICIMAAGSLRTAGSALFLKQRFGLGYILTAVVQPNEDLTHHHENSNDDSNAVAGPDVAVAPPPGLASVADKRVIPRLLALLRAHVPPALASQVSVVGAAGQEIKIKLPMEAAVHFEPMLEALDASILHSAEDKLEASNTGASTIATAGSSDLLLPILSYGVNVLSLEDVFVKAHAAAMPAAVNAALPSLALSLLPPATAAVASAPGTGVELTSSIATAAAAAPIKPIHILSAAKEGGTSTTEVHPASIVVGSKNVDVADLDSVAVKAEPGSPAVSLETIRSRGRKELKGCFAFRKHFVAILIKRFAFARRDMRTLLCSIIIPILLVAVGLALIRNSSLLKEQPQLQLSTAYFNTDPRSTAPVPIYPQYFPVGAFKSGINATTAAALGITELLQQIPAANATTSMSGAGGSSGVAPLVPDSILTFGLSNAAALSVPPGDAFNFSGTLLTTQAPATDWRSMSTMLLANGEAYAYGAPTVYGSLLLTGPSPYNMVDDQDPASVFCSSASANETALTYTLFVNTTALATAPTYLSVVNGAAFRRSVIASASSPSSGAALAAVTSITARAYPLPLSSNEAGLYRSTLTGVAALLVQLAFSFIPAAWASFIVKERECGAKHQQLISGVTIPAYWLANACFDLLVYMIPCFATIGLMYAFSLDDLTATNQGQAQTMFALFLLFGPAAIGITYAMSFLFKSHTTAQTSVLFANVACVLLFIISNVMALISSSTCAIDDKLRFVFRLSFGYDLGQGIFMLGQIPSLPATRQMCFPNEPQDTAALQAAKGYDFVADGWNLIYLAVEAPIGLGLAILLDQFLSRPNLRAKLSKDPDVAEPLNNDDSSKNEDGGEKEDEDVAAERAAVDAKVSRLHALGAEVGGESAGAGDKEVLSSSILIHRLRKVYRTGKGNKELKVAVRSLSFSVEPGQIFGFLGVNGAGKSSTLSILSGDILPTSGTALLAGHDILAEQNKVRRLLGYCSQFDPLLDVLTTKEHLQLYARIKGVPESLVPSVVNEKLAEMDLLMFANRRAGSLSGGNKRKLVVACALISSPPVLLLDEASSGMDVVSQRFMWSKIAEIRANKVSSVIVTTHSMAEAEALCDKVGIIVGGALKCLGSIAHLRHRHGRGYQCEVRLMPVLPDAATISVLFDRLKASAATVGLALAADASAESTLLAFSAIHLLAEALGDAARAAMIKEDGDGWQLFRAFQRSSVVPATGQQVLAAPATDVTAAGAAGTTAGQAGQAGAQGGGGGGGESCIHLADFLLWWSQEDAIARVEGFFAETFPGSSLSEKQGLTLRFRIPMMGPKAAAEAEARSSAAVSSSPSLSLGKMFGALERSKSTLGLESFTLSQVSLESVFNSFASQGQPPAAAPPGAAATATEPAH